MYATTTTTDTFTATVGLIPGYDHDDLANVGGLPTAQVEQVAATWMDAGGPPVVIHEARVYYPTGPAGGEPVCTLTGNRNPFYDPDRIRWVGRVVLALEALAESLGQTTAQVSFVGVGGATLTYLRTDDAAGGSPIWHDERNTDA